MAKCIFSNQGAKKQTVESSSMVNGSLSKDLNLASPTNGGYKSPRSQAPYKTTSKERGGFFAQSQFSIESDTNTIQDFLMKDKCGQIVKTKKIIEREQDRIEKVKKAREKAIQQAMEKSAKLILQERRYESNAKEFEKKMEQDDFERR